MKKVWGGACVIAFALFAAAPANAGDFKGFYVGVNVGGASGTSNARTSTVFSPTGYFATTSVPAIAATGAQNLSPSGFTGGAGAGYNFQHKAFVLGFEVDFGGLNMSDKRTATTTYPCCAPTAFTITQFAGTSHLFTFRPRIGFTGGPILIYGTGGLASSSVEYTETFTDTFATATEFARKENNQNGWAAGAGAEFKVGKHVSLKGEYLRIDLGDITMTSTNLTAFTPRIAFPTNVFTHHTNLTGNLYRFGFNYRF